MEVSPQDPSLMAMDLSKGFSVAPLTRGHPEAMDLAKKPEWYHRRPATCSPDIGSSYRSRASSSFTPLHQEPGAPILCRDMEPGPDYMNSALAPGLYRDSVHGNLWHQGFYSNSPPGPGPESSGGEESDSGSDVIFLVSSAKEPLLCSPFLQDGVRHIVEPLSPAMSSLDEGRGCYHLPQPLSSPSPDSSYSEDSSDSSVDIPVHHTRPVVLLSDLGAVYGTRSQSLVDISSDDSDVIEVSVTNEKTFPCKRSLDRDSSPPPSVEDKPVQKKVRRSSRIRKPVSETPPLTCSSSRHSLRRRAKNDAVGIYNESGDSDDVMEYAVRMSSSEGDETTQSQPDVSRRVCSPSEESGPDLKSDRKSTQRRSPRRTVSHTETINHQHQKPPVVKKTKTKRKPEPREKTPETTEAQKKTPAVRRRRRRRLQTRPSAPFPPGEPEITFKYAKLKEEKKKKSGNFCPFVHMEKKTCTVVNYQEEEESVRSSRGTGAGGGGGAGGGAGTQQVSSGFVPNTSCFQLARTNPEIRCQDWLRCCLCGQTANAMGLGDLHGPYHPTGPAPSPDVKAEDSQGPVDHGTHSVNSLDHACDGDPAPTQVTPHLDECWIHEDCGIWSAGVFLVRGRLYGLEEAARLAQETVCSSCQQTGAIMGCFQKGCARNYHYRCAIQSGCVLTEDNFSIRCPEHKKPFTTLRRRHKR